MWAESKSPARYKGQGQGEECSVKGYGMEVGKNRIPGGEPQHDRELGPAMAEMYKKKGLDPMKVVGITTSDPVVG